MVAKDLAYEQIEQLGARFHEQFQFVIQQQILGQASSHFRATVYPHLHKVSEPGTSH